MGRGVNKEVGGTADFESSIGGEGVVKIDFKVGKLGLKGGTDGRVIHKSNYTIKIQELRLMIHDNGRMGTIMIIHLILLK